MPGSPLGCFNDNPESDKEPTAIRGGGLYGAPDQGNDTESSVCERHNDKQKEAEEYPWTIKSIHNNHEIPKDGYHRCKADFWHTCATAWAKVVEGNEHREHAYEILLVLYEDSKRLKDQVLSLQDSVKDSRASNERLKEENVRLQGLVSRQKNKMRELKQEVEDQKAAVGGGVALKSPKISELQVRILCCRGSRSNIFSHA